MESVLARRSSLWVFHAVVAVAAACLLWAFSVPGISVLLAAGGVLVLGLATLLWAACVEAFRLRGTRSSWWFLVAPAMGVMVVALLFAGLPLQARWALSRDAFEAVVDDLPEAPVGTEWTRLTVPGRLGAFRITAAYRVPGGAVFYEANGSFFDDAGFAYLPDGPNRSLENGSFESPAFKPSAAAGTAGRRAGDEPPGSACHARWRPRRGVRRAVGLPEGDTRRGS